MNIKRIKWRNISVGLLSLAAILVGLASAEPLETLTRNTNDFMVATLTPESSGVLALGMILITMIAALKLLVQRNR